MYDKNAYLQVPTTQTGSFNGDGKDFVTAYAPAPGDRVDFDVTNILYLDETVRFSVEGSTDNITFVTLNQNQEGAVTAVGKYIVPIGGSTPFQFYRACVAIVDPDSSATSSSSSSSSATPFSITYSAALSVIRS